MWKCQVPVLHIDTVLKENVCYYKSQHRAHSGPLIQPNLTMTDQTLHDPAPDNPSELTLYYSHPLLNTLQPHWPFQQVHFLLPFETYDVLPLILFLTRSFTLFRSQLKSLFCREATSKHPSNALLRPYPSLRLHSIFCLSLPTI